MSTPDDDDPFGLERFVEAQARMYPIALAELEAGEKQSHWMWYVFPQLRGLGFSRNASFYGVTSLDEARAYLAHPLLGKRLRACTEAVLGHPDRALAAIFGAPDDMKFRSSMTLFAHAEPGPQHPSPLWGGPSEREAFDRGGGPSAHGQVLPGGTPPIRSSTSFGSPSPQGGRHAESDSPSPPGEGSSPFRRALDAFCGGEEDAGTLALLRKGAGRAR